MMMSLPKKIFITGTDTGVGKTYISAVLLNYFSQQSLSTLGIKPLASGGDEDALILQQAASIKLTTQQINPLHFMPPIAPHIAAMQAQQSLSVTTLMQQCEFALNYPADFCLVEGVGGWLTPLNSHETMADFAKQLNYPVILVVGLRLGCLNHALLTQQALQKSGVHCIGWIGNGIDPAMHAMSENIATLNHWLSIPCLTVLRFGQTGITR